MDKTTRNLAETVSSVAIASLPLVAVHEAKRRLLDSIACAVGAFHDPLCGTIRDVAGRYSGQPSARIWGTGVTSSVEMAGFANGTMVRYLDLSDTVLTKTSGHPSDMIAALVALAEGTDASGALLLEGIVAAYELYYGLCDATAIQKSAVDQSTAAALGTAGGASKILGLDANRTGNALSLALGSNVNLYNVRNGALSDWKACAGPNAAKGGVFAAFLAAEGITAPTAIFEGTGGLSDIVGPLQFVLDTAGNPRIARTHLKAYPVCYHGQSAVDAAMSLVGFAKPDDIESVLVETYEAAHRLMGSDPSRWAPTNRETADHSLPYTVGVTLSSGRLTSADYGKDRLSDPELRTFMAKIKVTESDAFSKDYPAQVHTRITITTKDGKTRTAETLQPKGNAQNPLSDEELALKLDSLWPTDFHAEYKGQLLECVWELETASSVVPFVDLLCSLSD